MNRKQRRIKQKAVSNPGITAISYDEAQKNKLLKQGLEVGAELVELNKLTDAEQLYKGLLDHAPGLVHALYSLGIIEERRHNTDKAIDYFERALKLDPNHHQSLTGLGYTLMEINQTERAVSLCKKSLEVKETVQGLSFYAVVLRQMGKLKESNKHLKRIIEIDPDNIIAHLHLIDSNKVEKDDPLIDKIFAFNDRLEDFNNEDKARINFSLAKIHSDFKEYDTAFSYYERGNHYKRLQYRYEPWFITKYMQYIQELFTPEVLKKFKEAGDPSKKPVFIVGMPRSGTTLTEQIISSHPDVYGAGELEGFKQCVPYINNPNAPDFINEGEVLFHQDFIDALSPEMLKQISQDYLNIISRLAPEAKKVTDKMPFNFIHIGLIKMVFPNAKLIHCTRNPLDTGLSIYRQNFKKAMAWSYDLKEIGAYINAYQDIMAYWHDLLGDDLYESNYENLVSSPEEETRKLIEFCDLDWDDACLSPHKTKRRVKTASIAQVRAPINTKSVEGWRKYEKGLQPLIETLNMAQE